MDRIIAYCGLLCNECAAYRATQADDDALREKVASEWSEAYGCQLGKDDINCDGCLGTSGKRIGHCEECPMRLCAMERSVDNCAHCPDYACEPLKGFFNHAPEAKKTLDGVRDGGR